MCRRENIVTSVEAEEWQLEGVSDDDMSALIGESTRRIQTYIVDLPDTTIDVLSSHRLIQANVESTLPPPPPAAIPEHTSLGTEQINKFMGS